VQGRSRRAGVRALRAEADVEIGRSWKTMARNRNHRRSPSPAGWSTRTPDTGATSRHGTAVL
jgi:hypothetical protein